MKKSARKRRIKKRSKKVNKSTKKIVRKHRKKLRKKQMKKTGEKKIRKAKRIKRLTKKTKKKLAKKVKRVKKRKKKQIKRARRKLSRKKVIKKPRRLKRRIIRARKKLAKKTLKKRIFIRKARSVGSALEQLFESSVKVQVMKLFFRNPEASFLLKEARKKLRGNLSVIKREMRKLEKIGLLKTKQISPRKQLFFINPNFDFFNELKELILKSSPVSKEKILKAIKRLGKIKLVLLSGLFIGDNLPAGGHGMSRADLLIVGDNINSRKLNTFIKNLEAEAGCEIRCVVMTTEEFNYRYDMYDRFVRDLLDEKCEFLVNKIF